MKRKATIRETKQMRPSKDALVFLDEDLVKNGIDKESQFNFYSSGNQIQVSQDIPNVFDLNNSLFMMEHADFMNKDKESDYRLLNGQKNSVTQDNIEDYYRAKRSYIVNNVNYTIRKNLLDALFAVLNNGIFKHISENIEESQKEIVDNIAYELYQKINDMHQFNSFIYIPYINSIKDSEIYVNEMMVILNKVVADVASVLYDYFRIVFYSEVNPFNDQMWITIQELLFHDIQQFMVLSKMILATQIANYFGIVTAISQEDKVVYKNNLTTKTSSSYLRDYDDDF